MRNTLSRIMACIVTANLMLFPLAAFASESLDALPSGFESREDGHVQDGDEMDEPLGEEAVDLDEEAPGKPDEVDAVSDDGETYPDDVQGDAPIVEGDLATQDEMPGAGEAVDVPIGKAAMVGDALRLYGEDGALVEGTGWRHVSGSWYWLDTGSIVHVGWLKAGKSWYFLDHESGVMKCSEVFEDGGRHYVATASGACPSSSWVALDGDWYLTGGSCALRSGWAKVKGSWYYLDPETHVMRHDEVFTVGDKSYVAKSSGVCPASAWVKMGGAWYLTDSSCALRFGWAKVKGVWYYLDPATYAMLHDAVFALGGKSYVATSSGACPSSSWVRHEGSWYLTDASCALRTGWAKAGGKWYYLRPTGTPEGGAGQMVTGVVESGGKRYFMMSPNGDMAVSRFVTLEDGTEAYADKDGVLGLTRSGGVYRNADGSLVSGWLKMDGHWLYLDGETGRPKSGWLLDRGTWYWLGSDGVMATGKVTIKGVLYCLDGSGALVKSGYQNPDGFYQVSSQNVRITSSARSPWNYVTPSRIRVEATRQECVDAFLARAREYVGTPYVWNYSCAPGVGVDCIGLVYQCAYACGMDLGGGTGDNDFNPWAHYSTGNSGWHSHDANNFWYYGKAMHVPVSSMQAGDVLWWPGHVAIYAGGGTLIEAYDVSTGVIYSSLSSRAWPSGCIRLFQ